MMIAMTAAAGTARAQSLFRVMGEAMPTVYDDSGRPMTPQNEEVRSASMLYIPPTKPRTFEIHQQVMILVDENSQSTSKESLETKKDMSQDASLKKFPSLKDLIEGELRTGDSSPIVEFGVADKSKYKGEGTYQRDDRFTAKISATIIDVKPNGVLVVEARKSITTNGETKTLVLSGTCRREDVTSSNTVLSSQLADLTIVQETTGELRDASDKGWITRVLEAVFSF
jgi:flagellar L-ring protein precursor FlgH